jgi:hypothetical protein
MAAIQEILAELAVIAELCSVESTSDIRAAIEQLQAESRELNDKLLQLESVAPGVTDVSALRELVNEILVSRSMTSS